MRAEDEGGGRYVLPLHAAGAGAAGRDLPHLRPQGKEDDPLGRRILKRRQRKGPLEGAALKLSKNRFAGFFFPQNEFCGAPFYLIGSGRPNYGLPRHTPHSRRGPEGPWLRPAGRFRQIFAKIWRATVFFPAHVREKTSHRKKPAGFFDKRRAARRSGPFGLPCRAALIPPGKT